MMVIVSKFTTK